MITALLSWKTEMVAFTSKLTVAEIRGTLLMTFITAVVFPLLPDGYIDPWHIVNPRSIWLTVIIVSALNFVNYVLLRQFGMKAIRYTAILGGFVNSAITSALIGEELKASPDFAVAAPAAFLLADIAMIIRNAVLVAIFSLPAGPQGSITVFIVLGPMVLVAAIIVVVIYCPTLLWFDRFHGCCRAGSVGKHSRLRCACRDAPTAATDHSRPSSYRYILCHRGGISTGLSDFLHGHS